MAGIIDYSALNKEPYEHEKAIARFFAEKGKNVIFLKPSNIQDVYTPDICMDGVEWEMKSPNGNSRRTIRRNLHKASKQSRNIIFDLSRIGIPQEDCIRELKSAFESSKHIRNMLIITKERELITLNK